MVNPTKKQNIFGVTEAALPGIKDMELRHDVEECQNSDAAYLRQVVFRDKLGNYFLYVKGGTQAYLGLENSYPLDGREILIPITPEALYGWAQHNLAGEECARALKEFKASDTFRPKRVWQYQSEAQMGEPGYVYEFLQKTDRNGYILFSTDFAYPYIARNVAWAECNEDGSSCIRDDLYMYYVTPETARRWAEARGMDEHTCQAAFGH